MGNTFTIPVSRTGTKATLSPLCHVVLLNDNDHTFEYVVEMLARLFGHSTATGLKMALEVHTNGRAIVMTTHRELAELRQEQIQSHGPDPMVARCKGSMTALLEPAT